MARRKAVAEATLKRVISWGRKSGRNRTENQTPSFLGASHFLYDIVGRSRFLANAAVSSNAFVFAEAREEVVGMQHVRHSDQSVTLMRAGLDFVAEGTQFFHARPDGGAAYFQSVGEVGARDRLIAGRAQCA